MPAIFAIGQTDLILTMPRRLPKNTAVMLHDEYSVMCLEFRPERSTIEREALPNRKGQRGNVYQPHFLEKWNPQSPAYGRFWIDAQGGERKRKTVSLGRCATQSVARLRFVTTSSEQGSTLPAPFVKFLFLVQHFGNKLNGG